MHDSVPLSVPLDTASPVGGRLGRPRQRPCKLHADKAYDFARCRRACHRRHIQARIVRRGVEDTQRLGRHRWVVERTFAWLEQMRRLATRDERRTDIHYAFTLLGCSLNCLSSSYDSFERSSYSPELNLIEFFWREVKYRWLPLAAYSSFDKLCEAVKTCVMATELIIR